MNRNLLQVLRAAPDVPSPADQDVADGAPAAPARAARAARSAENRAKAAATARIAFLEKHRELALVPDAKRTTKADMKMTAT